MLIMFNYNAFGRAPGEAVTQLGLAIHQLDPRFYNHMYLLFFTFFYTSKILGYKMFDPTFEKRPPPATW